MSITGGEEALAVIKKWQEIVKDMANMPKIVMDESGRIASAKTQMNERGSIKDRLAKTDQEAEAIHRADNLRFGRPTAIDSNLTSDEDQKIQNEAIDRLVSDMIEKTILKGF